ncbi:MAG: sigma-70 family RNA polymerase sigma factor [Comamonadaceae bacterium]|nr:MAG: sigma-70 family RNA polymerase sigma factor [Comamonadaceae bacterium]
MSAAEIAPVATVEALYIDHHQWLRGWLRGRLGCAHNAADLTQDTFVRVLALRDTLPALKEPRAYLLTTARHLMVDRARRDALERAWHDEWAARAALDGHYPPPELAVSALRTLALLSRALDAVSDKARDAFVWHYLDGQTHAHIAAQLGVSDRMVRKYLAQVLLQCVGPADAHA